MYAITAWYKRESTDHNKSWTKFSMRLPIIPLSLEWWETVGWTGIGSNEGIIGRHTENFGHIICFWTFSIPYDPLIHVICMINDVYKSKYWGILCLITHALSYLRHATTLSEAYWDFPYWPTTHLSVDMDCKCHAILKMYESLYFSVFHYFISAALSFLSYFLLILILIFTVVVSTHNVKITVFSIEITGIVGSCFNKMMLWIRKLNVALTRSANCRSDLLIEIKIFNDINIHINIPLCSSFLD